MEGSPDNKPISPKDKLLAKIESKKYPALEEALKTKNIIGKLGQDIGDEESPNIEADQDDTVNWVLENFNKKNQILKANIEKLEKNITNIDNRSKQAKETYELLIAKQQEILANQDEYTAEDLERYTTNLLDTIDFNNRFIVRLKEQLEESRKISTRVNTPEFMDPSDN